MNSARYEEYNLNRDISSINMDSDSIIDCLNTESLECLNYKSKTPVNDFSYEKKVDNYIKSISTNFNTINKTKKISVLCSG